MEEYKTIGEADSNGLINRDTDDPFVLALLGEDE